MTSWVPDSELEGYEQFTIELPGEPTYALEPAGSLVATLVRRNAPSTGRAILYLHGWNDYFFQAHLGDEATAMGYDFYALDLRRYGRSLRPRQLAGYVARLDDYFVELDAAIAAIRGEGHDEIVLMGHSTGGLAAVLYADQRPGTFASLILNSPWLELQANPMLRSTTQPVFSAAGALAPTTALPVSDNGFYLRSVRADADGEWTYNHNLKGDPAFLIRLGWAAAILHGHSRVAAGLSIDCPILVATSKRTDFRRVWDESLTSADSVLDVDRIADRASRLGDLVVLVRIDGALHDLVLSRPPVRAEVFRQFAVFLTAYAQPYAEAGRVAARSAAQVERVDEPA